MIKQFGLLLFLLSLISNTAFPQGYVDQEAVAPILNSQQGDIETVEKTTWIVYEYKDHNKDSLSNWQEFLLYIEALPGSYTADERKFIVELANRVTGDHFSNGRKLLVPASFPPDYRAYSPYPFHYAAADTFPKLFIIDKFTQTFAAYEYGKLVRWGLVSTGHKNSLTPVGRYNFNWKDEQRFSNAAPPGEVWEMFWVFNFHADWGIHVHQYNLPIGYAASHGCVRLSEADAIWNYNWANGWVYANGKLERNGTPLIVINNNPPGRPAHWLISGDEVISLVNLPADMMEIKPGTYTQKAAPWQSGW
jgi:hypothetical protein